MDVCLKINNLNKSYDSLAVIQQWNLNIFKGERVIILGPSGCGKTTFLRLVAGLEKPSSGSIEHADNLKIGFVFQESRLIPWRSIKDNLKFVDEKGNGEILSQLGLDGFENYLPSQLSGGMKQRVNLAR
ncbi:MAG: ATP-binding cassette domain-containing protein, partial [Anaerolineae bacterium]|nr:ATP-binding cassette domain-containing protein [Anaerolineae bacterium]